jgi:hypothetical protein
MRPTEFRAKPRPKPRDYRLDQQQEGLSVGLTHEKLGMADSIVDPGKQLYPSSITSTTETRT